MMAKATSREKLINAMADLILEKGLANTSPSDILARSEVGHGSLYHHFKGKEDLAIASINYNVDRFIDGVSVVFDSGASPREKLDAYFSRPRDIDRGCLVGQMARDREMMMHPVLAQAVTRGFTWIKEMLETVIADGMSSGDFNTQLSPSEAAFLILSTMQGTYVVARGMQDVSCVSQNINALKKVLYK